MVRVSNGCNNFGIKVPFSFKFIYFLLITFYPYKDY